MPLQPKKFSLSSRSVQSLEPAFAQRRRFVAGALRLVRLADRDAHAAPGSQGSGSEGRRLALGGHLDGQAEDGASPAITVAHLEAWEEEHGRFEPGEVALLLTGWSKHYVKGEAGRAFLHEPVVLQSRPAWPAPEAAVAVFLHERGVGTIGIDAPSMGSAEEGNEVHRAGLSREMAFIEGLTNLDRLPPRGASFVFLPIKIAVASGAPGRAIAVLPAD